MVTSPKIKTLEECHGFNDLLIKSNQPIYMKI